MYKTGEEKPAFRFFSLLIDMQTTKQLITLVNRGEINAHFELGHRLAFGKSPVGGRPWKRIYNYWKYAAENGHVRAIFYLGTCYDHGYGVKKNIPQAFNWFLKAAEAGHRDAQYNIGFSIEKENM